MRTRYTAALVAATLVTVGVAGGYAVHRHDASPSGAAAPLPGAVPSSTTSRSPVLAAATTAPSPATSTGATEDLAKALANPALGTDVAGLVVDATSGTPVFRRDDTRLWPPASTTKLMTAAAALVRLGPAGHLETSAVRVGTTVYLVGGGDVTLTATPQRSTFPQPAALSTLARQVAASIGPGDRVRLRLDASAWSGPHRATGWSDYVGQGDIATPSALEVDEGRVGPGLDAGPRVTDPVAQAGAVFAAALDKDGVHVVGTPRRGVAPKGVAPVGVVRSPPVSELVARMLTVSDNDLAEALGRTVARHDRLPADFSGAATAVSSAVRRLGVPGRALRLSDTSGLSRRDRVSAQGLVAVLRAAASPSHPRLQSLLDGLPTAGFSGTLGARYRSKPSSAGAGVVRAKTGTLRGVNTLAGLVLDRSGQLLAFAFLAPRAPSPGQTEPALDDLAARLAQCGCTG